MSGKNSMNQDLSLGPNNPSIATEAEQLAQRLQDIQLPIANVTRIMSDILPEQAKINIDAKEAIQNLVSHFIHHIMKKANKHCLREQRKIVTAEDILWAMNSVRLDNYVGLLTRYLHKYREQVHVRYLRPNIVRPNFKLALAPPTLSPSVLPIESAAMSSYVYPHFPPNVLYYDPATAAMTNVRDDNMMAGNDEDSGSAESSTATAAPYGLPRVKDS